MNCKTKRVFVARVTATALCSLFLFAIAALAGPPLVCHRFDIDDARSLPWTSDGWNLTGNETYSTQNLANDTIGILDSNAIVLVHMETLRRATLYARKDPQAAKELLTKVMSRAQSTRDNATGALALFDAGYLAEAYKQWIGKGEPNPALGVDGYRLVKKALAIRGTDPQMEFAAALITLQNPGEEHALHAQNAIAGAKSDSLLNRNLYSPFHGTQGETMAELINWNGSPKTASR